MTKRGFNLIEIAIVLAVIGLVIGGIYVAASAVTENNRRQTTQKQLLQIVANVRNMYATQPAYTIPTYAQVKAMGIFPGDLQDTGSEFLSSYGGRVELGSTSNNQWFLVDFVSIPQGACIDLLSKGFGSASAVNGAGLMAAGTVGGGIGGITITDGISIAEATSVCIGTTNDTLFYFNMRG